MIRVLHCVETIASGGVEQTLLTLIRGLDKRKFQHRIVCTWKGGAVAEALGNEGVEIITIGSFAHPFEWSKHKKVRRCIKEFMPHIIHGAVFEGMSMAAIGSFFGKVPVTILEETSDPQNRSKKANLLLRLFSTQADVIQAISGNVGRYLVERTGIRSEKIKIISNGVQFPKTISSFDLKAFRSKYSLSENQFIIGFVGRLFNDHKRVSDLIEAIKILGNKDVRVLIVGDGNDKGDLINLSQSLNILDQIIFVGYQSETNVCYELMNVFVIPSAREGFGLVAAEAMLQRLPVIATRVGGLQDIVVDGETGFLVPPFSPGAIAEKIKALLQSPDLRSAMGQKGYLRAMENYSAARYCKEIENLYLDFLKKKKVHLSDFTSKSSDL
ncbi:glycosyltransferase family 4 protein [Algoriphagus sp.]|uniref:glycosyltransferase family 4 protein n=1 Tax=Algoriphagus sp. TaxID=1872435 RepID=UPI003F6F6007